ncbi:MAG: M20 family metallopeptidase [Cyanobacteriota bacterium]
MALLFNFIFINLILLKKCHPCFNYSHINDYIHDNPEIGLKEFKAAKLLTDTLKDNGFEVKTGVAGLDTAFEATYTTKPGGPTIGILAEYDALEGMGHGCGHNCIAASAIGTALALVNTLKETPVTIKVFGTPAEETTGGKINMVNAGLFDNCDVTLMTHPSDSTSTGVKYLALQDFTFTYKGEPAHAAAPQDGKSALDGAIAFFNGINALRQFVDSDIRLHGIIRHGGDASNVIPEKAVVEYTVRANNTEKLKKIAEKVKTIAQSSAVMNGIDLNIDEGNIFDNAIVVPELANLLLNNAKLVGAERIIEADEGGSTDFGNVSHKVPSECLDIAFVPDGTPGHTQEWVEAGKSPEGHKAVITAAKAMALTAYDIIQNPELLQNIKKSFNKITSSEKLN